MLHLAAHNKKKSNTVTDLSVEQEDEMASWPQDNELLYNKKLNAYKDFKKKDALWESKAADMDKDLQILKTWYRSIRTRFTRLIHRKSGDGASELTERDRWILANFGWLKEHVMEVQKKTTVSLKEKIATASSIEDDQLDDPTDTESVTTERLRLEPLPRKSSAKKAIQEEDRLLSNIAAREEQSFSFQTKVLEMLTPAKATERTRFADCAKEVMIGIHPSLWLKFQHECSSLLYTYQEKSEEILSLVNQQQLLPQQPLYSTHQQTQYQFNPRSGPSATDTRWQPPTQQWPTPPQHNMPVWGSQNSSMMLGHGTSDLQMTSMVIGHSSTDLSSRTNTASVAKSGQPAFSLSKIVRDNILTDTPLQVLTQPWTIE